MARRKMTVERYKEIKRRLEKGHTVRSIARALGCSRVTIRAIRDGSYEEPDQSSDDGEPFKAPDWSKSLDWNQIAAKVRLGDPVKFLWEEKASSEVSYGNFLRQLQRRYPEFKKRGLIAFREFDPGELCEVDYSGKRIRYWPEGSKSSKEAEVFIGILGYSQLIFASAKEDIKSASFLRSHVEMYYFFGGAPSVTVCDCLKQGVIKTHQYDPDINVSYQELSIHYDTAIVPARPRRPKDKALVEGAVKLIMRLFRWKYRHMSFRSIAEINQALTRVCQEINQKPHTRFKTSRLERFKAHEESKLKPLPDHPFEISNWKEAKLHPDSHVTVDANLYSAPYTLVGKTLKVKVAENFIEIFHGTDRVALHGRVRCHKGKRVTDLNHLPDNARAYREATPQNLLSQSRFIHLDLHALIDELFKENALGHLRRAQGLIREARRERELIGAEKADINIKKAIEQMRRFDKIRVPYFSEHLKILRKNTHLEEENEKRTIQRKPGNPMLRHTAQTSSKQGNLKLVHVLKSGPQTSISKERK
jgi:hypothetical protein